MKKYSNEEVINRYKLIATGLGYPPMPKDLKEMSHKWIILQIIKRWGSFENFFRAVGLEYCGRIHWTDDKLNIVFKEFVRSLGHVPTINEVRSLYKKGDLVRQIYKRHGNYYSFLIKIGFKPKKKNKGFWTRDSVVKEYFNISHKLNYLPSYSDLCKLGYNDITIAIQRIFEGAENFYKYCEVHPRKRKTIGWNKDKVILEFRKFGEDFGRSPTEKELRSLHRNDLALAIKRYFGSYKEIQRVTELSPKTKPIKWSHSNIIAEYAKITSELGFPPTYGQLQEMKKSGLAVAISKTVGFSKILQMVGYKPRRKDDFWNEDKVKQEYLQEMEKLGRPPTLNELKKYRSDLFSQINRRFGGITLLAHELNFKVSKAYFDPLWKPWEDFVVDVCTDIYGGNKHKRLPNGGIPDFVTNNGVIIDAKLSYYTLIENDIIKYSSFAERVEFWIASKYVPISGEKVKYLGINDIRKLLLENKLTAKIPRLTLFEKRIDPNTQTLLVGYKY